MAVLRKLPGQARRPRPTLVRAMWSAVGPLGRGLSGLPARVHRARACAVRVRRSRPTGRPPAEVRGVATGRRCARRGHGARVGGRVDTDGGPRHLGTALAGPSRRSRVRPSTVARASGGAGARAVVGGLTPTYRRSRPAGSPRGSCPPGGDAGDVRGVGATASARVVGRRCPYDRGDRWGVRRGADRRGRPRCVPADCGSSGILRTNDRVRSRIDGRSGGAGLIGSAYTR